MNRNKQALIGTTTFKINNIEVIYNGLLNQEGKAFGHGVAREKANPS